MDIEITTNDDRIRQEIELHENKLMACARGCYQRDLLEGRESWSGSSLKGKASSYGARYAASREALIERMSDALPSAIIETALVLNEKSSRWERRLIARRLGETPTWCRNAR